MILTCENCHTRYLVPAGAIGAEGREVRCAACHHQWFQEPEDTSAPPGPEVEPIPEAVRPVPEGSSLPVIRQPGGQTAPGVKRARIAVAAMFLLVFAFLAAERAKMVHAWLPSMRFYTALHIAPPLPGQGLVLDQITASVSPDDKGVNILTLKGEIINPTRQVVKIPPLQAALRLDDGKVFDGWRIDPPLSDLAPNGKADFQTTYPSVPNNAKEVSVNLLLTH